MARTTTEETDAAEAQYRAGGIFLVSYLDRRVLITQYKYKYEDFNVCLLL
jgi:hypothetical protein